VKTIRTLLLCFALLLAVLAMCWADGVVVVGALTHRAALQPGESTQGEIVLHNSSDTARTVRCYQRDVLTWADGNVLYGNPASTPRSNASWIVLTPQQLEIPAGEMAPVYYFVQAPKDGELVGTYWSMLMVEPFVEGALEPPEIEPEEGKTVFTIVNVSRYAIRMVTNIGQSGTRELKFADKQLIVQDETRVLQLDLENTGQRYLRLLVWAELYDEEGTSVGRFQAGRRGVYPGCSTRFHADLSQVPPGKYNALVVADNGDEYVFGARYDLEIE